MSLHAVFEDIGHNVRYRVRVGGKAQPGFEPKVGANGYRQASYQGRQYPVHVLLWAMRTGTWPTQDIDHKNCDKGDNSPDNLRLVTHQQNMFNQPLSRANTTGYKGVRRQGVGFAGVVQLGGKHHYTRRCATAEEAHQLVVALRVQLHGEYANHGGPQ